ARLASASFCHADGRLLGFGFFGSHRTSLIDYFQIGRQRHRPHRNASLPRPALRISVPFGSSARPHLPHREPSHATRCRALATRPNVTIDTNGLPLKSS